MSATTLRGSSDVRIGVLSLRVVHGDPEVMHIDPDIDGYLPTALEVVQADPLIEVADQVLEHADPRLLSVGDGIMTIHARNGEVSYGLREYDDLRETWLGVRSDVADEDLLQEP